MNQQEKGTRRGFLAEHRFYLLVGVFQEHDGIRYYEEIFEWDRVKAPTRYDFINSLDYWYRQSYTGEFIALSCCSEFKSKADADAYESDRRCIRVAPWLVYDELPIPTKDREDKWFSDNKGLVKAKMSNRIEY